MNKKIDGYGNVVEDKPEKTGNNDVDNMFKLNESREKAEGEQMNSEQLASQIRRQISRAAANQAANVKQLVEETLTNYGDNYLVNHNVMTAFYRETIKKRRRNVSLSEAVINIYKSPYKKYQKREGVKVQSYLKQISRERSEGVEVLEVASNKGVKIDD